MSAAVDVKGATLESLNFDNSFVRELPADPICEYDKVKGNMPRQVEKAAFSRVLPTKVRAPKLIAYSAECAALIDLPESECERQLFADILAGNELFKGSDPFAACYGGHQFGNWAGQLGDGRAITLGEVINKKGERWELQLKGAGPTPYSRMADGRAVLRSSIREFLMSEAMHHLGVPTTRALALVLTGDSVVRDMFYNGNAKEEPGATVCRVAPSFIRFGNFEIFSARGDVDNLRKLADHTIRRHFPDIAAAHPSPGDPAAYVALLRAACRSTAATVAAWMRVGFVHGVMNTDNMSILGLTIDYGPYGWMDSFDPAWTPNTTDLPGRRYCFGNQPTIALWNLVRLANALYALVNDAEALKAALGEYEEAFEREIQGVYAAKLGLGAWRGAADEELLDGLTEAMKAVETDMTILYRRLADVPAAAAGDAEDAAALLAPVREAFYAAPGPAAEAKWAAWLRRYRARVADEALPAAARRAAMLAANPKYTLRNWMAQAAIDAAEGGDFAAVRELLDLVRRPYDEQSPEMDAKYFVRRPDWARSRPGCSALSCSS